ncbi:MAG: hypothetical protein ACKPFD_00240 [Dolichospermum sp.]
MIKTYAPYNRFFSVTLASYKFKVNLLYYIAIAILHTNFLPKVRYAVANTPYS